MFQLRNAATSQDLQVSPFLVPKCVKSERGYLGTLNKRKVHFLRVLYQNHFGRIENNTEVVYMCLYPTCEQRASACSSCPPSMRPLTACCSTQPSRVWARGRSISSTTRTETQKYQFYTQTRTKQ